MIFTVRFRNLKSGSAKTEDSKTDKITKIKINSPESKAGMAKIIPLVGMGFVPTAVESMKKKILGL